MKLFDVKTARHVLEVAGVIGVLSIWANPSGLRFDTAKAGAALTPLAGGAGVRLVAVVLAAVALSLLLRRRSSRLSRFAMWFACLGLLSPALLLMAGATGASAWSGLGLLFGALGSIAALALYITATCADAIGQAGSSASTNTE